MTRACPTNRSRLRQLEARKQAFGVATQHHLFERSRQLEARQLVHGRLDRLGRVVGAEQAESVAHHAPGLGAVLVAGADAANIAADDEIPVLAQGEGGAQADDRVDPLLVLIAGPLVASTSSGLSQVVARPFGPQSGASRRVAVGEVTAAAAAASRPKPANIMLSPNKAIPTSVAARPIRTS